MVTIDGKVALVYYQPIPKLVKYGDGQSVFFQCEHGISLALVEPELVGTLTSLMGGCCGNKRKIISEATQVQYDHWMHGNGGR